MIIHKFFKVILITTFIVHSAKLDNTINTGYPYDVEPADSLRYLKCSYLYNGLHHLALAISNIKKCTNNSDLVDAVTNSSRYSNIVKKQISSLYGINGIEIGPLWLLYVYTNIVTVYIKHPKILTMTMNSVTHENILKTCDYIVSHYKQDIIKNNCREGSIYHITYDNDFENSLKVKDYFKLIVNNCIAMARMIHENCENNSLGYNNFSMFKKHNIYLRKIVLNSNTVQTLIFTYNAQVQWVKSDSKILYYYNKLHELTWNEDHLLSFKVYYTSVFDLLQIIMLRLTLKHFMYLMHQKVEYIQDFTIRWLEILEEFVTILHPENVLYIFTIKSNIEYFVRDFPKIGNSVDLDNLTFYFNNFTNKLIHQLDMFAFELCKDLECNANTPIELNGKELFTINQNDQRRFMQHNLKSNTTVEVFSIENTKEYIKFIKTIFNGFDFNIIRSFMNYIDEISQYKLF
ncbi:uncharacterized protein LOC126904051 isoform X2 [Daktulosphaira vitifoliae]|uniref:uncharacterized protein LOC126904051 isoform X2 n=1 Tax=Daktulosphaira vitifoliae TaxID=58002 RepID=UPI0021AAED7A|nr:uncharacterized protein LOC126904051 isoform X2 [Daktulosphaira vitifoliae]